VQVAIGEQWSRINVRTVYDGAVLVLSQDGRDVILPTAAARKVAAAIQRTQKLKRAPRQKLV
jgi:hypothetical protein